LSSRVALADQPRAEERLEAFDAFTVPAARLQVDGIALTPVASCGGVGTSCGVEERESPSILPHALVLPVSSV